MAFLVYSPRSTSFLGDRVGLRLGPEVMAVITAVASIVTSRRSTVPRQFCTHLRSFASSHRNPLLSTVDADPIPPLTVSSCVSVVEFLRARAQRRIRLIFPSTTRTPFALREEGGLLWDFSGKIFCVPGQLERDNIIWFWCKLRVIKPTLQPRNNLAVFTKTLAKIPFLGVFSSDISALTTVCCVTALKQMTVRYAH